jgi:hypothetical protein
MLPEKDPEKPHCLVEPHNQIPWFHFVVVCFEEIDMPFFLTFNNLVSQYAKNVVQFYKVIWGWVKTLVPSEPQNSW